MKRPFISAALILLLAASLAGAVDIGLDKKLARACKAAISVVSNPDDHFEFRKTEFADKGELRIVTITAGITPYHAAQREKTYVCAFKSGEGLFVRPVEFRSIVKDGVEYNVGSSDLLITRLIEATDKVLRGD